MAHHFKIVVVNASRLQRKGEDQHGRYNGHVFVNSPFDYNKHNQVNRNLWKLYPCAYCPRDDSLVRLGEIKIC
jgi:hypothetical protein